MVLQPGTRLRDYEIISLIGRGGMGEVYKAKELTLDREVAIKVLTSRGLDDPLFLQRFVNEAKIHARLSHSNIVDIYAFFEEAKVHYIAMQYAPGITLTELIRTTGLIPEPRALAIFRQICEALAYAHARGVVHRDVKPSNVMVDPQDGDRVKVMDFGIARLLGAQHITRTGTQMGTVCYMSPEQVLGEKEIDHRSDIYSAGVLLYEMLTGILPYNLNTESLFKIQNRILQEPLPDPREAYPHISDGTVAMLKSFTQKEREDRPGEILGALDKTKIKKVSPKTVSKVLEDKPAQKQAESATMLEGPVNQSELVQEKTTHISENIDRAKRPKLKLGIALILFVVVVTVVWINMKLKNANPESAKPEMIYVAGGTFMMGSNDGEANEKPVHKVTVSSFYIGKREVTQREWQDVMGSNSSYFKGDDLPVELVSWYDAVDYCNKRSIKDGLTPCYSGSGSSISCNWNANGYRLPTEAEWEYAARGGNKSKGYKYSGSDDLGSVAWFKSNSGDTTHSVGTKQPNELGIYDMSGNVWEWCWDWFDEGYYSRSQSSDPIEVGSKLYRVVRGGSWFHNPADLRVWIRYGNYPSSRFSRFGVRLVRAK